MNWRSIGMVSALALALAVPASADNDKDKDKDKDKGRGHGQVRGHRDGPVDLIGPPVGGDDDDLRERDRNRGRRGQRNMRFRGMDRNGDGVITRGEWRGNDRSFSVHDRNRDGVLTGDEVLAGKDSSVRGDRSTIFDRLDGNDNGRIERFEWPYGSDWFDRLDRDDDGVIERWEVRVV